MLTREIGPIARRVVAGAILACALASTGLAAGRTQTPSSQPPAAPAKPTPDEPQRPTFRTEANLVRVDVFPMRGGAPVLDLARDEFQVFEDGVPQAIDSFEHVIVRPAGPQTERVEPNTQREGYQMAADPHNRVFVIFLDTYHVDVGGSHNIRRPLINLIDRVLGPDDLVGIITPEQPASQLVLARKTEVIQRGLTDTWFWGRRDGINALDPEEEQYELCYPPTGARRRSFVADEMIRRRREKITLDALGDLVRHLDAIREERKAIITVSDGWVLYRPSDELALAGVPVPPGVYVSPRGTLSTTDERAPGNATLSACDRDRRELGFLDNERRFRDLLREAARANASFYPVDPRGLPVFDTSIGADSIDPRWSPTPLEADRVQLKARNESLRTAAVFTGGLAVLNSNDIESGLKRVVADLTSYYLLGYYSTNTALDGGYRKIEVRVARPGVDVRARQGYRAASLEEITAGLAAPPVPAVSEVRAAVDAEIGRLAAIRHDTRLHIAAVPVSSGGRTVLKLVGELDPALARDAAWRQGGEAAIMVTGDAGASLALARVAVAPGARIFTADLPLSDAEGLRECEVHVRLSAGRDAPPIGQVARVALPGSDPPLLGAPLLFRRGPTTGTAYLPAADRRFLRSERVRFEAPLADGAEDLAGRLLDRTGAPLDVPVTISDRRDANQRWLVADLTLAPLTNGDYVVELTAGAAPTTERVLVGIRVTR